jgi:hypothetical protein
VPFEEVLCLIIEIKKEQAKTLQASKKELLSTWSARVYIADAEIVVYFLTATDNNSLIDIFA